MNSFTEKYMHLIFAIYSLVVFTGYIELKVQVNSLMEYKTHHEMEFVKQKKEFTAVKEEQIKRENVIKFVRLYRDKSSWNMFPAKQK